MLRRATIATSALRRRRCRPVLGNHGHHQHDSPPHSGGGAVRYLNVHEYIAMELMKTYGVRTPECHVAATPEEAQHLFRNSLNQRKYVQYSTLNA